MKDRLQILLSSEGIASSKFADLLGVNRSSISHLLAGRNNPSLDFLQKVLVKFPNINPDWLLLGQGAMYRDSENKTTNSLNGDLFDNKLDNDSSPIIESENKKVGKFNLNKNTKEQRIVNSINDVSKVRGKKVVRIVFFYDDNTFETYLSN